MSDDLIPEPLREATWRRKLSPADAARLRAWLAAHPETRAETENEAALNDLFERLTDAPLSSNFTARVLEAVRLEAAEDERKQKARGWSWRPVWLARVAVAAVVLGLGVVSFEHIQTTWKVNHVVQGLIASTPTEVPSPEVLQDFDAIQRLGNSTPAPDEELLSLMQ